MEAGNHNLLVASPLPVGNQIAENIYHIRHCRFLWRTLILFEEIIISYDVSLFVTFSAFSRDQICVENGQQIKIK